jgi:hypothetical protein
MVHAPDRLLRPQDSVRLGQTHLNPQAMERSKFIALLTGAISLLLGIAYLLMVQVLDNREMVPATMGLLW